MMEIVSMTKTEDQYRQAAAQCKEIFVLKNKDYGTSWRIFRLSSLTDQLYIKANRIRTIQEGVDQQIADDIRSEFIGLVNYGLIALIQIELPANQQHIDSEEAIKRYDAAADETLTLMLKKNNDYGEAWRQMRLSSLTDMILVKIQRLKQIEDNKGLTEISEGPAANYMDIINYAMFALIKLAELKEQEL